MLNLNRANRNAIMTIFALIALIFALGLMKNTSRYQPRPIVIKAISESPPSTPDNAPNAPLVHTKMVTQYKWSWLPGVPVVPNHLAWKQPNKESREGMVGFLSKLNINWLG